MKSVSIPVLCTGVFFLDESVLHSVEVDSLVFIPDFLLTLQSSQLHYSTLALYA